MSDNQNHITALFQLYLNNSITHDQYQELLSLLSEDAINQSLNTELKELWFQSGLQPIALPDDEWNRKIHFLIQQINEKTVPIVSTTKLSLWYKLRWVAAAVFLLALSSGIYYSLKPSNFSVTAKSKIVKNETRVGVLPGGYKAVLILADGSSIILDSTSNGTIAKQGLTKVIKLNTGKLVYNSSRVIGGSILYNTLSTPRGGQYQVTLSDGTVVWLNSSSSIRYPTVFTGAERKVEISGEAYFEVAKDASHPFKVKINVSSGNGGEVQVLGTHFNINAYENETTVRTTLFEGSVNVIRSTGTTQLKPGQQLQAGSQGQITIVNNADLEEAIAWKEGRFYFENTDIKSIMRQLARWYDIDVVYNGNISRHFGGTISRNTNILKVLNMLELTGEINFKVEGKKIIIMP